MSHARVEELERIAADYHLNGAVPDKFIEDICQEYCCNWLQTLISPDDRVVELGYGEGITLARLAPYAKHYTMVEGAPSLTNLVKARHPGVEVVESLFEDYQPDKRFDKILALHVMEHVDDPISLIRHLKSWLSPGGELVVVVPNKASIHRRLAVLMNLMPALDTLGERDRMVGHQRVYDLAGLLHDLKSAGLEPIEHRGFFLKTLPNQMMMTYTPALIQAMNIISEELPAEFQANLAVRARISA